MSGRWILLAVGLLGVLFGCGVENNAKPDTMVKQPFREFTVYRLCEGKYPGKTFAFRGIKIEENKVVLDEVVGSQIQATHHLRPGDIVEIPAGQCSPGRLELKAILDEGHAEFILHDLTEKGRR
jgi:hypothetical protein